MYIIPQDLKINLLNLGVSQRLLQRNKSLTRQQKVTYIELGRVLSENCKTDEDSDDDAKSEDNTKA